MRIDRIVGHDDFVALGLERILDEAQYVFLIVHDEHVFFAGHGIDLGLLRILLDRIVGGRKIHFEYRAETFAAHYADLSPVTLHNAVYHRKSQTCSFSLFLCGKEGVKDLTQYVFRDPLPGISDR